MTNCEIRGRDVIGGAQVKTPPACASGVLSGMDGSLSCQNRAGIPAQTNERTEPKETQDEHHPGCGFRNARRGKIGDDDRLVAGNTQRELIERIARHKSDKLFIGSPADVRRIRHRS